MNDIVLALILAKAIGGGSARITVNAVFDAAGYFTDFIYDNTAEEAE